MPTGGKKVRRRLFAFLARERRKAPKRGRGAYLRRFIEHVQNVTKNYADGLFHCYDDHRIPQTSNMLENRNGIEKRNLRRCSGRRSTSSGPGTSYGQFYAFASILNACLSLDEVNALLSDYDFPEFCNSRRELEQVHAPAATRRAYLRNPDKHLAEYLREWFDQTEI